MNNYKWQAFLEALKLYLVAAIHQGEVNGQQAAHVIATTLENTDNVFWQVRSFGAPVSEMVGPYMEYQLGHTGPPEWWQHSATVPES